MKQRNCSTYFFSSFLSQLLLMTVAPDPSGTRSEKEQREAKKEVGISYSAYLAVVATTPMPANPRDLQSNHFPPGRSLIRIFLDPCNWVSTTVGHEHILPQILDIWWYFFYFWLRSFASKGCPLTEKIKQFSPICLTYKAFIKCRGPTKASFALTSSGFTGNSLCHQNNSPVRFSHSLDFWSMSHTSVSVSDKLQEHASNFLSGFTKSLS